MVSQTERGPIIPYKVLTHQNVLYLLWLVYVQSQTDMKCYLDFHWLRHYICTTQAKSQITITMSVKKKYKKNVQSHPLYWKKILSRIIVWIWFLFSLKICIGIMVVLFLKHCWPPYCLYIQIERLNLSPFTVYISMYHALITFKFFFLI